MRLLVTGGAGFIGSNFIRYWLHAHPADEIVNLDLLTYAGDWASVADVEREHGGRYTFVNGHSKLGGAAVKRRAPAPLERHATSREIVTVGR